MTGHTNVGGSQFNIRTLKMKFEKGRVYGKTAYQHSNVLTWTNMPKDSTAMDTIGINASNQTRYLHNGFLNLNRGQIIGVKVNGEYYRFLNIRSDKQFQYNSDAVAYVSRVQLLFHNRDLALIFDFPGNKLLFGDNKPYSQDNWSPTETYDIEIYELIDES